jgi:hypothetical protein
MNIRIEQIFPASGGFRVEARLTVKATDTAGLPGIQAELDSALDKQGSEPVSTTLARLYAVAVHIEAAQAVKEQM